MGKSNSIHSACAGDNSLLDHQFLHVRFVVLGACTSFTLGISSITTWLIQANPWPTSMSMPWTLKSLSLTTELYLSSSTTPSRPLDPFSSGPHHGKTRCLWQIIPVFLRYFLLLPHRSRSPRFYQGIWLLTLKVTFPCFPCDKVRSCAQVLANRVGVVVTCASSRLFPWKERACHFATYRSMGT